MPEIMERFTDLKVGEVAKKGGISLHKCPFHICPVSAQISWKVTCQKQKMLNDESLYDINNFIFISNLSLK